jgi:hypothetical protein
MTQGFIRTSLNKLFFFNYGSHLLRPGTANWIIAAWFLAVAMAVLEGLTWGKILSIFLPENLPWVAALLGTIWGIAIVAIDNNFVTLDTAPDYRKATSEKPPVPASGFRAWFRNKMLMGTILRIVIISFSMALTGPFLARNLDERKVVQAIAAQNDKSIADLQARVGQAGATPVATVDAQILTARAELVREIQGKSGSGKWGDGPVAKAMRTNIESLEVARDKAKSDTARHVQAIAHMTPLELAQREGLQLLPDNADTRAQVRKNLEAQSDEKLLGLPASHVIASSIFLLLFLMMMLLKIYQPRAVAIYYNEHLQEAYAHYLKGGYADLPIDILPAADRHDSVSPMGGQRFDAWYHETYLPNVEQLQQSAEFEAAQNRRKLELKRLTDGYTATKARKLEAEGDLNVAIEAKWQIDADLQALATEIKALEDKIMENETTIKLKKLARLASVKTGLEAEERDARQRLAVIEKHHDEFLPSELAAVMSKIRVRKDQLGEEQSELSTKAVNDPALQALRQQRADLLQQQNNLALERIEIETDLKRIEAALGLVDRAVTLDHELGIDDGDPLDPDLIDLREDRRTLIRERDQAAMRVAVSKEQLAEQNVQIDRLRTQVREDDRELDAYQRDIRARESILTRATLASTN